MAEIQKLSSLQPDAIDWRAVESQATRILESQGKDLQVGCYLALAMFVNHGYPGLADALAGLADMSGRYWDGMFPQRPRARINAAAWLIERLEQRVPDAVPAVADAAAIDEAVAALGEFDAIIADHFPEEAPAVHRLREMLQAHAAAPEQPAAPPPPEPLPAERPGAVASPPPASVRAAAPADPAEAFALALESLGARATTLFADDPRDPRSYQWRRISAWGAMQALPALDERGLSFIGGPEDPTGFADEVGRREARADWVGLAGLCEARMREDRYWFDLQYWTHRALSQLGPAFTAAAETVRAETMLLLRRVPGLHELQFRDGAPFAGDPARGWIASDVLAAPGKGAAGPVSRAGASDDEDIDVPARAEALLREDRADEALGLLGSAIERAASGRERFRRRIDLIELLGGQREWRLAAAQVDQLDRELLAATLESWEPLLASDALQVAVTTLRQLARTEGRSVPEAASRADALFGRLARLDPMAALRLGS